jgi:hypothetical protein
MDMKLKIVSSDNALAIEVGANLEAVACRVSLDNAPGGYHLWVREGLTLAETQVIRKAITPFDPPVATDATLADSGIDALLCLDSESDARLSRFDIPIACAAQDRAADIAGRTPAHWIHDKVDRAGLAGGRTSSPSAAMCLSLSATASSGCLASVASRRAMPAAV